MSNVTYYASQGRLSDSVERQLLNEALASGESLSATSLLTATVRGIAHCFSAAFGYVVAVSEALNEARAQDTRTSRSY